MSHAEDAENAERCRGDWVPRLAAAGFKQEGKRQEAGEDYGDAEAHPNRRVSDSNKMVKYEAPRFAGRGATCVPKTSPLD